MNDELLKRLQGVEKELGALAAHEHSAATNMELGDLSDVNLVALAGGEALVYDLATDKWVNRVIDPTTTSGDLIVLYGTDTTNYAASSLGAVATASSVFSAYYASRAIDSDDGTEWAAVNAVGEWIYVDLQIAVTIGRYRILQGRCDSFKISYSDDHTTWTDVGIYPVISADQTGTFAAATARYWRFENITGGIGGGWLVNSLELYSPAGVHTLVPLHAVANIGYVLGIGADGFPAYLPPATPAAHNQAATTVTVADAGNFYTATEVEAALAELGPGIAKLAGIAAGAEVNVNADWNASSGDAQILNKPTALAPTTHATSHQNGGGDEISVAGLSGELADPQPPKAHKTSHENGGADEISVAGLSGVLADAQTPTAHASTHVTGGSDVIASAVAGGNAGLMTGVDKTKLDGIAAGAEVNVNADWTAVSGDAQILNKPATFPPVSHTHSAVDVAVTDTANYFTGLEVETILAEVGKYWAKMERANTFTLPQTIAGGTDAVQMAVKGYSSQTANIFEAQLSTGAAVMSVSAAGRVTAESLKISPTTYRNFQVLEIPLSGNTYNQVIHLCDIPMSTVSSAVMIDLTAYCSERAHTTAAYKGGGVHLTGNGWTTPLLTFAHEIYGAISDTDASNGFFAVYVDGGVYKLYYSAPRYAKSTIVGSCNGAMAITVAGDGTAGYTPAGTLVYTTAATATMRRSFGPTTVSQLDSPLAGITSEGGFYVSLVAAENLTRGWVVMASTATDGRVVRNAINGDMPLGVVFADAESGAAVKIVTSGMAYVLPKATITAARGNVIYSSATTAGLVDQASSVPAATTHFREIGHWIDTGTGNGAICRAVIHFN